MIPPRNSGATVTVASVVVAVAVASAATATAGVILRENVMTFLVTEFSWLGCRMNSPEAVCCTRSMRMDVDVTLTIRPYSRTPLLINVQICPSIRRASLGVVMRLTQREVVVV